MTNWLLQYALILRSDSQGKHSLPSYFIDIQTRQRLFKPNTISYHKKASLNIKQFYLRAFYYGWWWAIKKDDEINIIITVSLVAHGWAKWAERYRRITHLPTLSDLTYCQLYANCCHICLLILPMYWTCMLGAMRYRCLSKSWAALREVW